MNKLQLVQALKDEHGLSRQEAEKVVSMFFNELARTLSAGDRVEIRGLCSFFVKSYKAYTGRNPKTGKLVKVKTKKLPFFKVGRDLKNRVEENKGAA